MDLKDYISSGQIETYALNQLAPEEMAGVECMLASNTDLKRELGEIEKIVGIYHSVAQPIAPPAHLKQRVLDAINGSDAKVIPITRKKDDSTFYAWLAAASVALLLTSMYFNYNIYKQLIDVRVELADLNYDKSVIANNYNTLQVKYEGMQHDIAMLKIPGNRMVEVGGNPEVAPNAKAMVYFNAKTKEVYAEVVNLPPAPEGMEYQLWAIADGKPIDGGMMGNGQDTLSIHKMKNIEKADVFAISLEPKGGVASPTGKIYCISKPVTES